MWRHHRQETSFLLLFGDFFSQKQGIYNGIFCFQKTVSLFGDFSPKTKSLLWSSCTTLQLHRSCKHKLTNRAEGPKACSLVGSYLLNLMLTGLHSLQFRGSYLLTSTDQWFYMRTKLYIIYTRVRKKLQSAKCPSNAIRTKFPTCLHKASD